MVKRRGKLIASSAGVITLVILFAAGFAFKDRIIEGYYIRMLDSADLEQRAFAVRKLGEIRSARSIPRLVLFIKRGEKAHWADDQKVTVRIDQSIEFGRGRYVLHLHPVIGTLIQIGPPSIPELIELLERESDPLSLQACYALGELGPAATAAIPRIESLQNRLRIFGPVAPDALEKIRAR